MVQKMVTALRKFMKGRRGPDQLSLALLITAIVLSMISTIFRLRIVYLLGMVLYALSLWRMLSRNVEKRYAENAKFLTTWRDWSAAVRQFINRMKNIRKYRYFKCPECHSLLRLPRKVGEVTVTCGKCRHAFQKKA